MSNIVGNYFRLGPLTETRALSRAPAHAPTRRVDGENRAGEWQSRRGGQTSYARVRDRSCPRTGRTPGRRGHGGQGRLHGYGGQGRLARAARGALPSGAGGPRPPMATA